MSDPRVYFAAERTLLAWVRTGITVIGLGFVVARFGLFLAAAAEIGPSREVPVAHWHSNSIGIALVLIGAFAIFGALSNHRHYVSALPEEDRPRPAMPWLAVLVAMAIGVMGILLAVYLAVS